jgi:hypothetical protein
MAKLPAVATDRIEAVYRMTVPEQSRVPVRHLPERIVRGGRLAKGTQQCVNEQGAHDDNVQNQPDHALHASKRNCVNVTRPQCAESLRYPAASGWYA